MPESELTKNFKLRLHSRPSQVLSRMLRYGAVPAAMVSGAVYLADWVLAPNSQLFGTSHVLGGGSSFLSPAFLGAVTFVGFSAYWLARGVVKCVINQFKEEDNDKDKAFT